MSKQSGMTLLEVMVAVVILLIGVGFVLQSNAVSQRYKVNYELQQQMLFYAAGVLEGDLVGEETSLTSAPFSDFAINRKVTDVTGDANVQNHLQQVEVTVEGPSGTNSITIITYRVKP